MSPAASVSMTEKATFFPRLIAYLIDGVIVAIPAGIIQAIFTSEQLGVNPIGVLLIVIISIGYYLYFWTNSGQTPGKKLLGLRVVSKDESPITTGQALLRLIGYSISGLFLSLGFLWAIWDGEKQGWHDKIAGTYVVKV